MTDQLSQTLVGFAGSAKLSRRLCIQTLLGRTYRLGQPGCLRKHWHEVLPMGHNLESMRRAP